MTNNIALVEYIEWLLDFHPEHLLCSIVHPGDDSMPYVNTRCHWDQPRKHEMLNRCWFNAGPASPTLTQHQTNTKSIHRVCWEGTIAAVQSWKLIASDPYHDLYRGIVRSALVNAGTPSETVAQHWSGAGPALIESWQNVCFTEGLGSPALTSTRVSLFAWGPAVCWCPKITEAVNAHSRSVI